MPAGRPAGWPGDLPGPLTEEFAERAVGWLLDRGPAELRGSGLERDALVLAYVVERHVAATADGLRGAYATLRAELGAGIGAARLAEAQRGLERVGALVTQQAREVALVREALGARSPRLAG